MLHLSSFLFAFVYEFNKHEKSYWPILEAHFAMLEPHFRTIVVLKTKKKHGIVFALLFLWVSRITLQCVEPAHG